MWGTVPFLMQLRRAGTRSPSCFPPQSFVFPLVFPGWEVSFPESTFTFGLGLSLGQCCTRHSASIVFVFIGLASLFAPLTDRAAAVAAAPPPPPPPSEPSPPSPPPRSSRTADVSEERRDPGTPRRERRRRSAPRRRGSSCRNRGNRPRNRFLRVDDTPTDPRTRRRVRRRA